MAELSAAAAPSPEGERPARGPGDGISDVLDSTEAGGRIIRGGVLRFATYVAMVALSVLSAALLTRHLGVVRFGEYTTVLSLVGIVASITDAGMSTVGTREFAISAGAERDALMRDLLGLRMTLTACGVVLVTAFALAAGYSTALLAGAVLASLGTIALVVQHTHTIPLTAALRLGTLSALELARQVLTVGAIVALVVVGAGVAPLLAVTLAVNLVLIPPTARLARRQIFVSSLRKKHCIVDPSGTVWHVLHRLVPVCRAYRRMLPSPHSGQRLVLRRFLAGRVERLAVCLANAQHRP